MLKKSIQGFSDHDEHESTDKISNLISRQIIEGKLKLENKDSSIINVEVNFNGMLFDTIEIKDNKFQIEITERFENGKYNVVWNVMINGVKSIIIDSFIVSNDSIDPTLPIDLQYLKDAIV